MRDGKFVFLIAAILTLFFSIYTFASYFLLPFLPGLLAFLELLLITLGASGVGCMIVKSLGFSDISPSQKTLIGASLGLGILSLSAFFLAAIHYLNLVALTVFLSIVWIVGFTELKALFSSVNSAKKMLLSRPFASLISLLSLSLVLWCCLIPPHQYDSLVYHLPLAANYVKAHGLVKTPWLFYSHFPQNGEMLFAISLLLKSDILAQMFMWFSLFLSSWWIFEIARLEIPMEAVILSIVLLLTQSSVMLLSASSYVEPLVMLWTTAAVLSFLRWEEIRFASPDSKAWLILSAVFSGLALGTKYYAGITVGILGISLWGRTFFPKNSRSQALKDAISFTLIVTILFSPWMIKNWLWVHNPFFPFFNPLFKTSASAWNKEVAQNYFNALAEYRSGLNYAHWFDFPLMLLTNSLHFGRGMDVLGGLGWEILFWSLPLAVWFSRKNQFLRRLLAFSLIYIIVWFLTGVVLRFLIVLCPLLCLLAGNALEKLKERLSPSSKIILTSAVSLIILTHLLLFLFVNFGVFDAGQVLLGLKSRTEYLSQKLLYYPCANYASQHAKRNDKILIMGEQRSYYAPAGSIASSIFAPNLLIEDSNSSPTEKELKSKLKQKGVTEILWVPEEMRRLGDSLGKFTAPGKINFQNLLQKSPILYRSSGCILFSVR